MSFAALAALMVFTPLALAARGEVVLVSRAGGATGAPADDASSYLSISADGRHVAFESNANNLSSEDVDSVPNIFLRDVETGTTTLISRADGPNGAGADDVSVITSTARIVSADGHYVAFESQGNNLSPDDDDNWTNVYVRDTQAGTTTFVSRESGPAGAGGIGHSFHPTISADGRYVAFVSDADNLSPDDNNSVRNVFVRNLQTGTLTWVSRGDGPVGGAANGQSSSPTLSADGRYVAFDSLADNLGTDDNPVVLDVFVRDLQTEALRLVSRASGATGTGGNGHSETATISDDGLHVAFGSRSTNLSPDAMTPNDRIYVRDLQANTTALVSRATGLTGAVANGSSSYATISADGRYVGFDGNASNLHPDDTNTRHDVYVRDVQTGTTFLVSRAPGQAGAVGDDQSYSAAISRDGRYVAFNSAANNLSADDSDMYLNIFRRDILGTPPRCSNVAQAVAHNTAVTIQLTCTDDDGDAPTRSIVSGPAHGTLGPIDQSAGTVSYTPTRGYSGPDSFSFRGSDATGNSNTATATFTVAAAPKPTLRPGRCANLRRGTNRANRLNGTNAGDRILGLGGNDRINGLRGADCLLGGTGRDRILGGLGDDRLEGGTGNDTLTGGRGRNSYFGGSGHDMISAANGVREQIDCGAGRDRVTADRGDRVRQCERVRRVRRR